MWITQGMLQFLIFLIKYHYKSDPRPGMLISRKYAFYCTEIATYHFTQSSLIFIL